MKITSEGHHFDTKKAKQHWNLDWKDPMGLTEEKWDKILQDIILGFNSALKLIEYDYKDEGQRELLMTRYKIGIKLFDKWFFDLWH